MKTTNKKSLNTLTKKALAVPFILFCLPANAENNANLPYRTPYADLLLANVSDEPNDLTAKATIKATATNQAVANPASQNTAPAQNSKLTDTLKALATDITWQRLLLIKKGVSTLDNPKFFLADNGHDDAYAELLATYQAMVDKDMDAVCRFPARVSWLGDKLGLPVDFGSCTALNDWLNEHNAERFSLAFSEEHPNVLGSAFAHVLIKADTQASIQSGEDKDAFAINYTVARNSADGEAEASVKSVVGGYAGVMEFFNYAKKRDVYVADDKRNMWEYTLNTTPAEVRQMMLHIWEVKDMARPYYFTHDNCATEILRLIDVVRPDESLREKSGKVTIPSEIARLLNEEGLVVDKKFLPSAATVAQAKLNALQSTEQANEQSIRDNALSGAFALEYDKLSPRQWGELISTKGDPSMASPTHRIGLGVGTANDKQYANLDLRSAYQDVLDRAVGVREFLDVSMLSLRAKADEDKLKIDELTVFSTRSYNPVNSAKNGDDGKAWGQHLKLLQVTDASDTQNDDHLVLHLALEKGRSWVLGTGAVGTGDLPDSLCYVMGAGMGQVGKINEGYRIGAAVNSGCIHHINDNARIQGEIGLPYWYQGSVHEGRDGYFAPYASVGVQYDFTPKDAVRLSAKISKDYDDTGDDVRIQYLRYF